MSQMGQKPTLQSDRRMSVLPPKADVRVTHRALGRLQTHAPQQTNALFDQLVGPIEQLSWDSQAKRLSGPEIDDQLEFCGLLNWQIQRGQRLELPPLKVHPLVHLDDVVLFARVGLACVLPHLLGPWHRARSRVSCLRG